jgi:hypothetical protein
LKGLWIDAVMAQSGRHHDGVFCVVAEHPPARDQTMTQTIAAESFCLSLRQSLRRQTYGITHRRAEQASKNRFSI